MGKMPVNNSENKRCMGAYILAVTQSCYGGKPIRVCFALI